jgi:hypothetical protein
MLVHTSIKHSQYVKEVGNLEDLEKKTAENLHKIEKANNLQPISAHPTASKRAKRKARRANRKVQQAKKISS